MPESVWPNTPFVWGESASILTSDEYEWTTPTNLGPRINSPKGDGSPWVSEDELTLIFASSRPGALGPAGEYDLWQCTRSSVDEDWSEPVNLGESINLKWFDAQAEMSADGRTMVFVSVRPGSHGAMDLWMATRESTTTPWRQPVNLGEKVNSPGIDNLPCLLDDGLRLVFSSNRDGAFRPYVTTRKSLEAGWSTPALFSGTRGQGGRLQLLDSGSTLLYSLRGVGIFLAGWDSGEQKWKHDVFLPAPINDRLSKTGDGIFRRSTNTLYSSTSSPTAPAGKAKPICGCRGGSRSRKPKVQSRVGAGYRGPFQGPSCVGEDNWIAWRTAVRKAVSLHVDSHQGVGAFLRASAPPRPAFVVVISHDLPPDWIDKLRTPHGFMVVLCDPPKFLGLVVPAGGLAGLPGLAANLASADRIAEITHACRKQRAECLRVPTLINRNARKPHFSAVYNFLRTNVFIQDGCQSLDDLFTRAA